MTDYRINIEIQNYYFGVKIQIEFYEKNCFGFSVFSILNIFILVKIQIENIWIFTKKLFHFECFQFYNFFQFEGTAGEKLIQVSAEFTKNQKFSIEELKERRKRDHKLDLFLNEQRLRPECRRLGLEALLPVEHQRLVKYPLLLEQLAKQCDKESEEYAKVRRCVDRSREILDSIDKQVAEAQNIQRLAEIQRNLDTSGLEKMAESPITNEYRVSIIKIHFFSLLQCIWVVFI